MRILLFLFLIIAILMPMSASAQTDVRQCTKFGTNWYYSPGSDICVNAMTGETRDGDPDDFISGETKPLEQAKDANEGVALSLALPNASVDPGKTFGAAMNFGTFNGESAIGVSGAFQPADGLTINGAVGVGLGRGTAGGRAGINYSW